MGIQSKAKWVHCFGSVCKSKWNIERFTKRNHCISKIKSKRIKMGWFWKTITLSVNGKTINLYDDPHLKSHAEGSIYDIVQEVGLGKEKYFETYKLKEGILAKDFIYDKLVFAHDKEISFINPKN